jgi:hypothetical protein
MENLIDKTYFVDENKLTGLNQTDADDEQSLNRFIAKYQKDYLARMFGEKLSLELPHEITDLIVDIDTLTSPLAEYVYYKWQRSKASIQTNAGVKVLHTQNTTSVSPIFKMSDAWNRMVLFNQKLHTKLEAQETIEYKKIVNNVETTETLKYSEDIKPYVDFSDEIFYMTNQYGI